MKVNRCFLACLYITFWGFIIPLIQTHNGEQTAGVGGGGGIRKIGESVLKWQEMIQKLLSFNASNELNYCFIT